MFAPKTQSHRLPPKREPGPISQPVLLDPQNKPKPRNLSQNSTPLRNDPMWQEFDTEGFEGVTPYRPRRSFTDTMVGFQGLIDRVYELMNTADFTFTKYISRSTVDAPVCWSYQHEEETLPETR